jgi:hypothetical protein
VDEQPGLEAVHSPSYSAQLNSNSTPFVFVAGTGKILPLSFIAIITRSQALILRPYMDADNWHRLSNYVK